MANYILKALTKTSFNIVLGRKDVGFVRQINSGENTGKWIGRIDNEMVICNSSKEAFYEIVKVRNRIALCGVNDETKAIEALNKRNEAVTKDAIETANKFKEILSITSKDPEIHQLISKRLVPQLKKRKIMI